MKKGLVIFFGLAACACGRAQEGESHLDCIDSKDNDSDGRLDCEDDGCAMDDACVEKNGVGVSPLADQSWQSAIDDTRRSATQSESSKGACGPTFEVNGLTVQSETNNKDVGWEKAGSYCDQLKLGNYEDWRLPTQEEAVKIVESGQLKGEPSYVMWTSTTKESGQAVIVGISGAVNELFTRYEGQCRARCVRGAVTK